MKTKLTIIPALALFLAACGLCDRWDGIDRRAQQVLEALDALAPQMPAEWAARHEAIKDSYAEADTQIRGLCQSPDPDRLAIARAVLAGADIALRLVQELREIPGATAGTDLARLEGDCARAQAEARRVLDRGGG